MVKFLKSFIEPDPKECSYWVDLTADEYMSVIKYYDGSKWVELTGKQSPLMQLEIINNLTSSDKDKALSALLGKILNDTINQLLSRIKVLEDTINKKAIDIESSKRKYENLKQ